VLSLRRLEAEAMSGADCFDADYYAAANPDVRALLMGARSAGDSLAVLYRHYALFGMAEGRPHRWKCGAALGRLMVAPLQRVVHAMADADPQLPGGRTE
jgi:hypothetical protein